MGDLQRQRYTCKFCDKICESGRSLGGHMRAHLAEISFEKNQSGKKSIGFKEDHDQEIGTSQSEESPMITEEPIGITDLVDSDQNSNYELRDNPKKSWRISHQTDGLPSLKKSQSNKSSNKMASHCKECGKGFSSDKAMYGHMKSHSKKQPAVVDSISSLETLIRVRRKRSKIRYVSYVEKEAAESLVMLSKDVIKFTKMDPVSYYCDDNSAYYGGLLSHPMDEVRDSVDSPLSDVEVCDDDVMSPSLKRIKLDAICSSDGETAGECGEFDNDVLNLKCFAAAAGSECDVGLVTWRAISRVH